MNLALYMGGARQAASKGNQVLEKGNSTQNYNFFIFHSWKDFSICQQMAGFFTEEYTGKTSPMTKQFENCSGEEFQEKSHFRGKCYEIFNNLKNAELRVAKIEAAKFIFGCY